MEHAILRGANGCRHNVDFEGTSITVEIFFGDETVEIVVEAHQEDRGLFSSQWCRCLETPERLALGQVEALPELNSFFEDGERCEPQTAALREWLARYPPQTATVLVSHQVNIAALTGVYARSGETVVLKAGADGLKVVGCIPPP